MLLLPSVPLRFVNRCSFIFHDWQSVGVEYLYHVQYVGVEYLYHLQHVGVEYLYHVLRNHASCGLPEEALYAIRYHSFYPWHDANDYMYLCDDYDIKMLEWVKEFK